MLVLRRNYEKRKKVHSSVAIASSTSEVMAAVCGCGSQFRRSWRLQEVSGPLRFLASSRGHRKVSPPRKRGPYRTQRKVLAEFNFCFLYFCLFERDRRAPISVLSSETHGSWGWARLKSWFSMWLVAGPQRLEPALLPGVHVCRRQTGSRDKMQTQEPQDGVLGCGCLKHRLLTARPNTCPCGNIHYLLTAIFF